MQCGGLWKGAEGKFCGRSLSAADYTCAGSARTVTVAWAHDGRATGGTAQSEYSHVTVDGEMGQGVYPLGNLRHALYVVARQDAVCVSQGVSMGGIQTGISKTGGICAEVTYAFTDPYAPNEELGKFFPVMLRHANDERMEFNGKHESNDANKRISAVVVGVYLLFAVVFKQWVGEPIVGQLLGS